MTAKTYCTALFALIFFMACKTTGPATMRGNDKDVPLPTTTKSSTLTDTAGLVKNIIAGQAKYTNKPISVLLKDLEIQIKSYFIINSNFLKIDGIMLSFHDEQTRRKMQGQDDQSKWPATLHIIFQRPVPVAVYNSLREKSTGKGDWSWGPIEKEFYSKQIIQEIW